MRSKEFDQVPERLWASISGRVHLVCDNIEYHRTLVESNPPATSTAIAQAKRDRRSALEKYDRDQKQLENRDFQSLRQDWQVNLYQARSTEVTSRIQRGKWLQTKEELKNWLKKTNKKSRCIWIRGIPGAGLSPVTHTVCINLLMTLPGKTFLTKDLVQQLQLGGRHVLSVFLTYQCGATRVSILQSLLFKAAEYELPWRYRIHELDVSRHYTDPERLKTLLCDIFKTSSEKFVTIDGLDEIDKDVRKAVLGDLFEALGCCPRLRLLISSRDEYEIEKELYSRSVSLCVHRENKSDIADYVSSRGDDFIHGIDPELDGCVFSEIKQLIQSIAEKANGMFLYARLVIDVVSESGSIEDIRAQMLDLPHGLNEAYERILERIKASSSCDTAVHILQWMACARYDMIDKEIQQALAVKPGTTDFSGSRRKNLLNIRSICGPIIEIERGTVRFVHFSAKEYISHHQFGRYIDLAQAHSEAALVCLTYLSFSSLDVLSLERHLWKFYEAKKDVLAGNFILVQYAATSWLYHVKESIKRLEGERRETIFKALSRFLHLRIQKSRLGTQYLGSFDPTTVRELLKKSEDFAKKLEDALLNQDGDEWVTEDPTTISIALTNARAALEKSKNHPPRTTPSLAITQSILKMKPADLRVLLRHAVKSNQLGYVQTIFQTRVISGPESDPPSMERHKITVGQDGFDKLIKDAAAFASAAMIEYLLAEYEDPGRAHRPINLNPPFRAAIKRRNFLAISVLLSKDLRNGPDAKGSINTQKVLECCFEMWDADILQILVDKLNIRLPVTRPKGLWRWFSTEAEASNRGAEDPELLSRVKKMKNYLDEWPEVYTEGVTAALQARSPDCLTFFLENGGDPNAVEWIVLWKTVTRSAHVDMEMIMILLRHGSNIGSRLQQEDPTQSVGALKKIEAYFGMRWPELVERTQRGEQVQGMPKARRAKMAE
ncbi:hypothetical protein FALCPG4_010048 [Fusarium falciforme]